MSRSVLILILCAFAATMLPAQTPTKASKTNRASISAPAASNQELNLQAYVNLLRKDLNKSKNQVISEIMQFDTDQAAAFWPVYKDFQTELNKIGDQIVILVQGYVANYDSMTNELADQLATKLLDIEQQRNDLKRKYYEKLKGSLGAVTATRFLQVENQVENLMELQIAAQLPVVGASR